MGTSEQTGLRAQDGIPLPPDELPPVEQTADLPRPRARSRSLLREVIETVLLVVAIYTLVNLVSARFIVDGSSMSPNFATGQFIIVSRLSYLLAGPGRGDVVVFQSPDDPERDFIKRVIGLPGERIAVRDDLVFVNEVPLDEPYINAPPRYSGEWTLGPNEFFVLGDNRNNSQDSHSFGPLARSAIIGQAWIVYWPPQDWRIVPANSYDSPPPPTPLPSPVPTQAPTVTSRPPAP